MAVINISVSMSLSAPCVMSTSASAQDVGCTIALTGPRSVRIWCWAQQLSGWDCTAPEPGRAALGSATDGQPSKHVTQLEQACQVKCTAPNTIRTDCENDHLWMDCGLAGAARQWSQCGARGWSWSDNFRIPVTGRGGHATHCVEWLQATAPSAAAPSTSQTE